MAAGDPEAGGAPSYHYFRINADSSYTTYPSARDYYTTYGSGKNAQPNTFPEAYGNITYNAVALDVDIACGQCHVGGNGVKNPYGIAKAVTSARPISRVNLANFARSMHGAPSTPTVSAPEFSLASGTYPGTSVPLSVTLYSATPGATILYSTNGGTPTTPYTGAISITTTTTINAKATLSGYADSAVVSATYTIQLGQAGAPTFSPAGGTYNLAQTVTLSSPAGGATILYCTGLACTPTTPYTTGIPVSTASVIRAQATVAGSTPSNIVQASYNIVPDPPSFFSNVALTTPFTGGVISGASQTVYITAGDATMTIYYAVSTSGVLPTSGSPSCTSPCQITLTGRGYLRAIAQYAGGTSSAVATAVYSLVPVVTPPHAPSNRSSIGGSSTAVPAPSSSSAAAVSSSATTGTTASPAVTSSTPQPARNTVSTPQTRTAAPAVYVAVPVPVLVDDSADSGKETKDEAKKKEGKADEKQ